MSKFQITLVRPQGFPHTEAFREVAETLQFGLRSLGHTTAMRENVFDLTAKNIVLGAHLLSPEMAAAVPAGSIIYNLEQIGGPNLPPQFYETARRSQVWDYCQQNIDTWQKLGCNRVPIYVPLGYVPELTRIKSAEHQDIDVLFYGSLNERRNAVVKALKAAGAKVHTVFGIYGAERDELIARSKIVLNVHFYDAKIFEIVRVSYLLANSKVVVSECCPTAEQGLADCVVSLTYEEIVDSCMSLLKDTTQLEQIGQRGFKRFSQRKESDILSTALQASAASFNTASEVQIPTTLNLGSGKDWRENFFNVDFDPYWEPDAVLDFNHPLPIGKPLQTGRFGVVTLQNDSFDEIIANDSLEHIPSLMTAMNSCLNLLKVGGLFRISVPYDLVPAHFDTPPAGRVTCHHQLEQSLQNSQRLRSFMNLVG